MEDMQARLGEQGIRIVFRQNVMGDIYGVTFIDNGTRSVFNGSSLGKQYVARAFLQKIGFDIESLQPQEFEIAHAPDQFPGDNLPIVQQVLDAALGDEREIVDANQRSKKKKSNRLQIE